jgi:type II secretion system protein J
MTTIPAKRGFTLIEILVAMALITVIIAMVYGSYRAASKSAGACSEKIAQLDKTRKALAQISRQLSCSYTGRKETHATAQKAVFKKDKKNPEKPNTFFDGDSNKVNGQILHFVTTTSAFPNQKDAGCLFEVIYKFDKNTGLLSFSQTEFVGTDTPLEKNRFWLPIGTDITNVKLMFYDGQKWLEKWNIKQKLSLPCAVKVDITADHQGRRLYNYSAIAPVYSQMPPIEQNNRPELVSANIL